MGIGMIKSVIYFLVDKTFNHSFFLFFFGDHPHRGDLSLGYHRYLISALHPQVSAEAAIATQAAQAAFPYASQYFLILIIFFIHI